MVELIDHFKYFAVFSLWCSVPLLIRNVEWGQGENLGASISSLFYRKENQLILYHSYMAMKKAKISVSRSCFFFYLMAPFTKTK